LSQHHTQTLEQLAAAAAANVATYCITALEAPSREYWRRLAAITIANSVNTLHGTV